eukprot:10413141-Lingulodinium_polyedra.AAC.1
MAGLTAITTYNWRVLWWSLPTTSRKDYLSILCVDNLRAHRAQRMPDERGRIQYKFLGLNARRDLFAALTGLGASTLQTAREQTLAGTVSWSSLAER